MTEDVITLDYGSGGKKTSRLIEEEIVPRFENTALAALGDAAVLPGADHLVFSTDSFVVSPAEFPGGNIGKLAVCGTVNDVAMAGGKPLYLSLSLILEEGLPMDTLRRVLDAAAAEAKEAGVSIVTGDTKVVEKGRGDGLYINTAGIGELVTPGLSPAAIRKGDAVIVSGTVGEHGTAVMLARNPGLCEAELKSDCAPVHRQAMELGKALGADLRVLRDPTRGGLATTLNEFIEGTALGIEIREPDIPVSDTVQTVCDMLGLDPLYCACEGRLIAVTAPERADEAVRILHQYPGGEHAAVIGNITDQTPGRLIVRTKYGSGRIAAKLAGAQLPRIC